MFRTNWKKWTLAAVLSAALLPAATFAKAHGVTVLAKQPTVTKTSATESQQKKKLTHKTAPAKKLLHRATPSKKLVSKSHPTKKLSAKKVAPAKLTHKTTAAPKKLTSKTAHQSTKLSAHKKIQLNAKGKTVKA